MTILKNLFALGAVLVASASIASASPITGDLAIAGVAIPGVFGTFSLTFDASGVATGVDFTAPQQIGGASGTLTPFTGAFATIENFSFNSSVDTTTLYLATEGGNNLSFVIDTFSLQTDNGLNTAMSGTGMLSETGFDTTEYTWSFSTTSAGAESFGLSQMPVAATPEPNSLMLLGTGLVGAAGMLFRRRSISL